MIYEKFLCFIIFLLLITFSSCSINNKRQTPNIVYMPDMYYSDAYEPYSEVSPNYKEYKKIKNNIFKKNSSSSILPVEGTVPKTDFYDSISYEIKDKGFNFSKKIKISPIRKIESITEIINSGKQLYNINCSICHGENGDGQGFLVKNEKILGVPSYKDRSLSIGSIYYVITYGKNNMASYSSQLNKTDRWKISEYVMYIKNNKNVYSNKN